MDDQNQQGVTDEQTAQAQAEVGGQREGAGTEQPAAEASASVSGEGEETQATEVVTEGAESTTGTVTGDGSGEPLPPIEQTSGEVQTAPAAQVAPEVAAGTGEQVDEATVVEEPAIPTLRDHMDAKIAAVTVKMTAPEDGTCNPHTVDGSTYAVEPGTETTVQAQHTYSLLDAGWKIVVDGWEEGHAELRRLRDELYAIPEALHHMQAPHLSDIFERVKRWFE